MKLPIPKSVLRRLKPAIERGERFLREWEWTWTSAFVAGLLVSLLALWTLAIIPSWWLYFADNTLKWQDRILVTIRDAVAIGWLTVWAGAFVVTPVMIQKIRRRLRGEQQSERYTGGYR